MSQGFTFIDDDGVVIYPILSVYGPRVRVQVPLTDRPSRTKQADTKSADINFIVARYKKTGELPVMQRAPMFADIPLVDFKESMDLIRSAEQSFAQLPAHTRAAFNNDPAELLKALDSSNDPKVHQYLFDVGMFSEPPKAKEPPKSDTKSVSKPKKGSKEPELPLSNNRKALDD